jgi:hypothetical protein
MYVLGAVLDHEIPPTGRQATVYVCVRVAPARLWLGVAYQAVTTVGWYTSSTTFCATSSDAIDRHCVGVGVHITHGRMDGWTDE